MQGAEKQKILSSKSGKVVISNVAKLDVTSPIPLESNGTAFYTQKGRYYIPFFDKGDNFLQLLLEAKLLSPTCKACVDSKTKYSIGEGWFLNNTEKDESLTEWAKHLNKKGNSLNDISKIAYSGFYTSGNSYIEVLRGKVGSTKFVKLIPRPFLDCRLTPVNNDGYSESVIISREFRKNGVWKIKESESVEIPIYYGDKNQKWLKDASGEHAMIHIKNEEDGYDYYGMPSNVASLPQQLLEYKAARYNLDNFENNLVIGGVIVLQGNLTEEEANKLGKNIIFQHSGDGKRGRYVVLSSENGIQGSKIEHFQKQEDGDFIEADKRWEEKIVTANEWDAYLASIQRGGSLGNGSNFIRSIFDIKYQTVIKPVQAYIVEKFLKTVLQIVDEWTGSKYSNHDIGFKTVMPISFMGDVDVNAILTKNEGRKTLGLSELKEGQGGDTFIKESKQLNLFDNHVRD